MIQIYISESYTHTHTHETWFQSLGQEDPLEKGMGTHSSILVREIPWTEEAWRATVHGVTRVRHDLESNQ